MKYLLFAKVQVRKLFFTGRVTQHNFNKFTRQELLKKWVETQENDAKLKVLKYNQKWCHDRLNAVWEFLLDKIEIYFFTSMDARTGEGKRGMHAN